ncbi:hypothetical protein GCM10009112_07420 [Marinomonas arenicola]|uniref:O-antigen ligase family protein n=1 Tax=Marinomonas TaxID=28253 RepID=UPI0010568495|nr:O-antigen ligase family protein [Marinomonas sp. KMM3893]
MRRLEHTQQGNALALIGFISICLFTVTKLYTHSHIANIFGLPMAILGFFAIYRYGKNIQVKTPLLLLLASILLPLISWFFAHLAYPDLANESPRLDKLLRMFLFIPIAWWIKDSPKKVFLFWSLAALAVLASPWISGDGFQEIIRGWQGYRVDFGLKNAGHTSLFFGTILIGLICFSPRLYLWKKSSLIILIPCLLFCAFTMIAVQTRAGWLALIVCSSTTLIYFFLKEKNKSKFFNKKTIAFIILTLIAGSLLYKNMGNIVEKRSKSESSVIDSVLSGNFDDIPYTSVGIRVNLWRAALARIEERPILGWGINGQSIAIKETTWLPDHIRQTFGHLHNSYFSILTNYGLLGLLFYVVWFGWIFLKILNLVSKGSLGKDIGYFSITVLSFWSIVNLFESYLFFWTGVVYIQALFGGLLALIWQAEIKEKQQKNNQAT